jgi:glutathione S-transferase
LPDLYTKPETAALAIAATLEEIGASYRSLEVGVDITEDDYRSLNPDGTVPTYVDGDLVLYETIAILLHLVDRHPQAGLAPAVGTDDRAVLYRTLAYLSNSLMAAFYRWFKADEMVADPDGVGPLQAGAVRDLVAIGARIERELGDADWLVGDRFSVADILLALLTSWAVEIDGLALGGARLAAHAARVSARPAAGRILTAPGYPAR